MDRNFQEQTELFISELTHCAATENEQRMANLVARLNYNSYFQVQVQTAERHERQQVTSVQISSGLPDAGGAHRS